GQKGGGGGAANTGPGLPTGGTGTGTGTPTPGMPGTTPGVPNPNQFPNPNQNNNRFPEQPRPIFLSGKVILDDGTPPPEPVTIERVCNGTPHAEAYTDSKGRFSFQLGQSQGVLQDASMSSAGDSRFGGFGNQGGTSGANSQMGGLGGGGMGATERALMGC